MLRSYWISRRCWIHGPIWPNIWINRFKRQSICVQIWKHTHTRTSDSYLPDCSQGFKPQAPLRTFRSTHVQTHTILFVELMIVPAADMDCALTHFPWDKLPITLNSNYPSDSHKGHTHTHNPIQHSKALAFALFHTPTQTLPHTHALPSVLCRRWWWPVFGRLMAVCSSQPSHLITLVTWYLDVVATTPGQESPFCHRSSMLTVLIRNGNARLWMPCAKWYASFPSWKSNMT